MTQTFEIEAEELQATLDGVYNEVQETHRKTDYSDVWTEAIADLERVHLNYFQAEAGPEGPWAPLADSTARAKGHAGILWETTRLMASLIDLSGDAIRELYEELGNSGFTYGTGVEYAHFHMSGTSTMPARVFLGITSDDVDVIMERVLDAAVEYLHAN